MEIFRSKYTERIDDHPYDLEVLLDTVINAFLPVTGEIFVYDGLKQDPTTSKENGTKLNWKGKIMVGALAFTKYVPLGVIIIDDYLR